ncbi:uncharacterized protein LOC106637511 [Copidosoma floridanum]|uniref:uncharacterized protein LOC106637511 n=1 Tax=Copidosoma floridanum TaxID=29053 RepID=UPI0006C96298|nr:uncharacterized protein LOC106637511 [Copidosoma floridanum]
MVVFITKVPSPQRLFCGPRHRLAVVSHGAHIWLITIKGLNRKARARWHLTLSAPYGNSSIADETYIRFLLEQRSIKKIRLAKLLHFSSIPDDTSWPKVPQRRLRDDIVSSAKDPCVVSFARKPQTNQTITQPLKYTPINNLQCNNAENTQAINKFKTTVTSQLTPTDAPTREQQTEKEASSATDKTEPVRDTNETREPGALEPCHSVETNNNAEPSTLFQQDSATKSHGAKKYQLLSAGEGNARPSGTNNNVTAVPKNNRDNREEGIYNGPSKRSNGEKIDCR